MNHIELRAVYVRADVCRKLGISTATFYLWRKKYSGLGLRFWIDDDAGVHGPLSEASVSIIQPPAAVQVPRRLSSAHVVSPVEVARC